MTNPIWPTQVEIALRDFKETLISTFGLRFSRLTLFGSFARSDFRMDSDIDLLLVLKDNANSNKPADDWAILIPLISRYLLEYGFLFSVIIKSESELTWQKLGLIQNVDNEGIAL